VDGQGLSVSNVVFLISERRVSLIVNGTRVLIVRKAMNHVSLALELVQTQKDQIVGITMEYVMKKETRTTLEILCGLVFLGSVIIAAGSLLLGLLLLW